MELSELKEQMDKIFSRLGEGCGWHCIADGEPLEEQIRRLPREHELFPLVFSLKALAVNEGTSEVLFISVADGKTYVVSPGSEDGPLFQGFENAEGLVEKFLSDMGMEGIPESPVCPGCGQSVPTLEVYCPHCGVHPSLGSGGKGGESISARHIPFIIICLLVTGGVLLALGIMLYVMTNNIFSMAICLPVLVMAVVITIRYYKLRGALRSYAPEEARSDEPVCGFCLQPVLPGASYCVICGKKVKVKEGRRS